MRYGLIFWGGSGRINEILLLQKKALRAMNGSNLREHCKPLFVDWQIQTVVNLFIFDLINYILKNPEHLKFNSHDHNTRFKNNAMIESHRLSKTSNSHIILSVKLYNVLKESINAYPEKKFLSLFYIWLLENPFYNLDDFLDTGNVLL